MTICEECDHMHPDSRSGPSWRAMCSKHPRIGGEGFVTKKLWDKDSPFLYCKDVNGGACPIFTPRKEPK